MVYHCYWGLLFEFKDQSFEVSVPDIIGGCSYGKTVNEAWSAANEQVYYRLKDMDRKGGQIPKPSSKPAAESLAMSDLAACNDLEEQVVSIRQVLVNPNKFRVPAAATKKRLCPEGKFPRRCVGIGDFCGAPSSVARR